MTFTAKAIHIFSPHHSNNHRAKVLHPSSLVTIIVLFLLFQSYLSVISGGRENILGYQAANIPSASIITLTNKERSAQGLSEVRSNDRLNKAAQAKAYDMFAKNYWAHVSPQGTQPWYFFTEQKYSYRYAGENLARDFQDPESVVKAWLASPTHRENLLSNKYQDIGVAVVDGKLDGKETTLVVQLFGTPLSQVASNDNPPKPSVAIPALSAISAPTSVSISTPTFAITKYMSILLLGMFVMVLTIDVITVYKRQIARWTSKSIAHLAFTTFLLVAATFLSFGQII